MERKGRVVVLESSFQAAKAARVQCGAAGGCAARLTMRLYSLSLSSTSNF